MAELIFVILIAKISKGFTSARIVKTVKFLLQKLLRVITESVQSLILKAIADFTI